MAELAAAERAAAALAAERTAAERAVVAPVLVEPAVVEPAVAEPAAEEPAAAVRAAAAAAAVARAAFPAAPRAPLPSPAGHADRPRQFLRHSFVAPNDCAAPVRVLGTSECAAAGAVGQRMWRPGASGVRDAGAFCRCRDLAGRSPFSKVHEWQVRRVHLWFRLDDFDETARANRAPDDEERQAAERRRGEASTLIKR